MRLAHASSQIKTKSFRSILRLTYLLSPIPRTLWAVGQSIVTKFSPFQRGLVPDALSPVPPVGRTVDHILYSFGTRLCATAWYSLGDQTLGKKLYCGNLNYDISSSDLEQLFGQYGMVESAQVIVDRDTGRSKGFGFIEMGSDADAEAAINGLHESMQGGRALTVNEAKPRENRGGGGGGGRGYGGGGGGGGRGYGGGGGRRY